MDIVTGVGVLDKTMQIIHAVEARARTLGELREATGLPRATAHRLAAALEEHGMLRRDAAGRFELGHGLVPLGRLAAARFPLEELARPAATALRDLTGESVQLFVREGVHRRCVLSLESTHGLRWIVPEGAVFPLGVGSAGRVLDGQVGRSGWVQSVGEREPGVASVSAPVVSADGAVVAAISVSGPIERLSRQPGKRYGTEVVEASRRIVV